LRDSKNTIKVLAREWSKMEGLDLPISQESGTKTSALEEKNELR